MKANPQLQLKQDEKIVNLVAQKIQVLERKGAIEFPPDYSPQNALRSAWLILQDLKDKNKKPALEVCSKASVFNALFDMVIQGLNPVKNQCYFIVYGGKLSLQRSYFGSMLLAKRVNPEIKDFNTGVVYEGDEFEWEISKGKKIITKHKQTIKSINSKKVIAAYAEAIDQNGEVIKTEIMTFDEIKEAWRKSPNKPFTEKGELRTDSTHYKFIGEMAKKTVLNRLCKSIINSSNDAYLKRAVVRQDLEATEQEIVEEETEALENSKVIDVEEALPESIEPPVNDEDAGIEKSKQPEIFEEEKKVANAPF